MVWCRAGLRGENLSVYTDFFTSHKRLQTSETRMHYTMCCMQFFISIQLIPHSNYYVEFQIDTCQNNNYLLNLNQ